MINDEQFEHKVKASLDDNLSALDSDTRQRLADVRRRALSSQPSAFAWPSLNNWLPASALALCSLFAVFLVFNPQHQNTLPLQNEQVAVFELLTNADTLEEMTDPDFYAWIDENLEEDEIEG